MYIYINMFLYSVDVKLADGRVLSAPQICSREHHKYKDKQRKANKNTENTTI